MFRGANFPSFGRFVGKTRDLGDSFVKPGTWEICWQKKQKKDAKSVQSEDLIKMGTKLTPPPK